MSRHTIEGKRGQEVVVGYDRPLNNFFAHVYDKDGGPIASEWGVDDPAQINKSLGRYVVVSSELLAMLRAEQAQECRVPGSHPPSLHVDHRQGRSR